MRIWSHQTSENCPVHSQGVARIRKRVELTKEARLAINARRLEASQSYKKDLGEAWAEIDKVTENLAATHHKSVRRVQGELHMRSSLVRAKHSKTSAWNAFSWKKNMLLKEEVEKNQRGDDESRLHTCLPSFSFFLIAP
jgi:hypothetical protein